jgi:hypothetical protein
MNEEVASLREDMQRAIGMRNVSLGENPSGVGNYSQLAALQEQDGRKLDPIVSGSKMTTAELVEDVVPIMREHWPTDRIIALAGSEGNLSADQFNASKIPTFFQVSVSRGAVQPRSQAAKLKMVDDIATFSINSGHPLPPSWLKESYEAGEPQPLPEESRHDQLDKALLENEVLSAGQVPPVAYYDDHPAHILVVRSLQSRADSTGDKELSARCEKHALAHLAQAEANAQHQSSGAPGMPPSVGAPAQTPGSPQNKPSITDATASTYPQMSYPPAFPQ